MAYKIRYGSFKKPPCHKRRKLPFLLMTLCFFLLFLIIVRLVFPEQLLRLRRALLEYQTIQKAVTNLRSGRSVINVVSAFCEDLLHGN